MFSSVLDLIFPADCAGCGVPGRALCGSCVGLFGAPRLHRPEPAPVGLPPVVVAASYAGSVRNALLAYKEHGRRELSPVLATALAGAVRQLVATAVDFGTLGRPIASPPPVWSSAVMDRGSPPWLALVPVPSRSSAVRARGGDHMLGLARGCQRPLAAMGLRVRPARWLRVCGRMQDSAGLSAPARAANLAGAFGATAAAVRFARAARDGPVEVIVVDDLVTTGATASEACRALAAIDIPVLGIAAVAGTLRRCHSLPI